MRIHAKVAERTLSLSPHLGLCSILPGTLILIAERYHIPFSRTPRVLLRVNRGVWPELQSQELCAQVMQNGKLLECRPPSCM